VLLTLGLFLLLEISFGTPIKRTKSDPTSNSVNSPKRRKNVRFNDGTANKTDYYNIDDMLFLTRSKQNRAGQAKESYRWPNGRIPFTFAPGYSDEEMKQIYYTMKHIEHYTCVRFVFRTENDENYLIIRNVEGKCQSFVGNVRRGAQQVALDPESRNCAYPNFPGHVLHELIHAIGFFHEHARDDRDNYIEIMYENLSDDDDVLRNFYKNSDSDRATEFYGVPYNYGSIMHYSERAGSINGENTIQRRHPIPTGVPTPLEGEMGQRERLSEGDVLMIRNMYKDFCPDKFKMLSHGVIPAKFPDVLDWVVEHDKGEVIDFPVESTGDDDDDEEDYDYSLNAEKRITSRLK
jgi:hypothetical protein